MQKQRSSEDPLSERPSELDGTGREAIGTGIGISIGIGIGIGIGGGVKKRSRKVIFERLLLLFKALFHFQCFYLIYAVTSQLLKIFAK